MIRIRIHIIVWSALYAFWVWATVGFHPTLEIAMTVSALLTAFYAAAVYLNGMVLLPKFYYENKMLYFILLLASMLYLTFLVLGLIRLDYIVEDCGEFLGDYWENYAIDLFGMAVYVSVASFINRSAARFRIEWE